MKSLFTILILLSSYSIWSQKPIITKDFSLSVGEKYKHLNATNEYHFQFGQRLLSLKKINKSFILERHSLGSLNRQSKTSSISDKGDFVGVLQLKDTVLVYFRQKNKLLAQKLLISQSKIARPHLVIDSKEKIADDFGFSSRFGYESGSRINAFAIKKSVDGSKFVIVYKLKSRSNSDGNIKDVIHIQIYNEDMTLDWKRDIVLPYSYKQLNTDDFSVGANGDFHVLASVFEKERVAFGKRNKLDTDFHLELFTATKNQEAWKTSELQTDKSIEDAVIYASGTNEPVVVGFYADKDNKGLVKGSFVVPINGQKKVEPMLHPIPTDTIAAYSKRKETQINKGLRYTDDKDDLEEIHINKVVANPDGSYNIFAEQRYTNQTSTYVNGVNRVTFEFYYRNAYGCKMDGSGNMEWFNQLPKNQFGNRGKQSMSYAYQSFGGAHYLLYWDTFNNLKRNVGEFSDLLEMKNQDYMFITAYKINDRNGSVEKLPVLNSLEVNKFRLSSFELGKVVSISNADLLIEGHDGRGSNYLIRLRGK